MTSPSWPTPPDNGRGTTLGLPQRPATFTPAWPPIGLPGSADPLGDDATIVLPRITAPIAEQAVALAEAAAAPRGPIAGSSARTTGAPAAAGTSVAGTSVAGADEPMRTARTSGLVRAGATMAVATVVSRATGFLAKLALVAVIGFSLVNDAYIMANTLPNIVFELLLGGVLTSVAIPLLSGARADPDGGQGYTNRLVTTTTVGLVVATGLAMLAAPLLTRLYLSGDQSGQEQH
ncbi:MAG TPA: lipid II flippase MurJ, partial [Nakamurella sp.]